MNLRHPITKVLAVMIFATQVNGQSECYERVFKPLLSKYQTEVIQTDLVCNGRVVWSKVQVPDAERHELNPFQNKIRTFQYDSLERISSISTYKKIFHHKNWNDTTIVDSAYQKLVNDWTESKTEFNYRQLNINVNQESTFSKEIESIILNFIVKESFYYPRHTNFYYEYNNDTLKIKLIELDYASRPKTTGVEFDKNGIPLNVKNENDISVWPLGGNKFSIRSKVIPQKPSPRAGFWRKTGINCIMKLDEQLNIVKLDRFWMGITLYDYKDSKLRSMKMIKNDEVHTHKIVQERN